MRLAQTLFESLLLVVVVLVHHANGFPPIANSLSSRNAAIAFPWFLSANKDGDHDGVPSSAESLLNTLCNRRNMLVATTIFGAASSVTAVPPFAAASQALPTVSFAATWSAIDGLNSMDSQFVSFDAGAYQAMRDDPTRTPLFKQAILRRLGQDPGSVSVLDLGTGPFALFAILAAEAGAGKVYAIEANRDAAASARKFVQRSGFADVITILEGFSSNVELPEKVDFAIAEIVGSIASEEGAYATIRDAHGRFLKNPNADSSWIPSRIQTYAAPASYTLHNLFGPPEFDWDKLGGEPVRFNCRDMGLELLANPVLVEDISFSEILTKQQDGRNGPKSFTFTVDPERIRDNSLTFYDEFRRGKSSVRDSEVLAEKTAQSLSGIALWPRLILDDKTVVDSRRFGDGGHQRSHWQSVLPIMSSRPVEVKGGDKISIVTDFKLPSDVTEPPIYSIRGQVG